MKKTSVLSLSLFCWALFLFHPSAAGAAGNARVVSSDLVHAGPVLVDRYIVEVRDGFLPAMVAGHHGVAADHVFESVARGFAGEIPPGRLNALRADPRVLRIIPDRRVRAIAKTTASSSGGVTTQVVPAGVKRIGAAPGSLAYTGAGVGVAVLDTGVDLAHTDLRPLGAASFSAFGPSAQDDNGHGTHVAGIIAARNNTTGVVGVAPGATIYAVKVLDASGQGSDAAVIAGLDWVARQAALVNPRIRVVNLSLGRAGNQDDNPLFRSSIASLRDRGIAVIVAAGNDATLEISQQVPAAYPEAIAIASSAALAGTNQNSYFSGVIGADTASYFTSDGGGVTVSAPGEDQENIDLAGTIT